MLDLRYKFVNFAAEEDRFGEVGVLDFEAEGLDALLEAALEGALFLDLLARALLLRGGPAWVY